MLLLLLVAVPCCRGDSGAEGVRRAEVAFGRRTRICSLPAPNVSDV